MDAKNLADCFSGTTLRNRVSVQDRSLRLRTEFPGLHLNSPRLSFHNDRPICGSQWLRWDAFLSISGAALLAMWVTATIPSIIAACIVAEVRRQCADAYKPFSAVSMNGPTCTAPRPLWYDLPKPQFRHRFASDGDSSFSAWSTRRCRLYPLT